MAEREIRVSFFAHPVVGSALTVASGVSFLILCMLLPLVGPAAMNGSGSPGAGPVPHLRANIIAFVAVSLVSLALAVLAIVSKIERRKVDGSPLPYAAFGLAGILVLLLLALAAGLTKI